MHNSVFNMTSLQPSLGVGSSKRVTYDKQANKKSLLTIIGDVELLYFLHKLSESR